jgi:multisubunit Na+/H+ antiporter MnhB subunit
LTPPVLWPVARLRQFGGLAWIIAAGLAVGGTFAPLIEAPVLSMTVNAWGPDKGASAASDVFPQLGIPIVVGAVVLVVAALLALTSTRLHPASAAVLASRLLGVGATGLTAGATATVYLAMSVNVDRNETGLQVTLGLGMWLLVAASVVGLVGMVLTLVPRVEQRVEPETPPMGVPVVRVLDPEFDEPEPEQRG